MAYEEEIISKGPAPIKESVRTVIEKPEVEGVEITKGVTIIAGDLAGIAKDPVYASNKTVLKTRAVVEKIPVKSVNKINYLSSYGSNIFNKTRSFESVDTGKITFGSTLDNVVFADGGSFELKVNGDIGAEALIELVLVRKKENSIKLVRELPPEIRNIFLLLEEGPKT